jgi:glycosyltransferase involved in cell wall biosynthesis
MTSSRKPSLLVFNMMVDADDPILGFATVWLNALAARCERVDVVTMQVGRAAVAENVRVYSVGREKGYSEPRRAVEFYRILFGLLRQNHYDACFAHMMQLFALMGASLLKLWRVPVTLWYAHKAVPTMLRWAEKTVDQIVTSSPEGFRLPSAKVHLIGQGVDTNLFQPLSVPRTSDQPFTLISIGRIAPVKSLETLIEAVKQLVDSTGNRDIRLRLIGNIAPQDIEYADQLRQMVKQHDLSEIVEFPGAVVYAQVAVEYQHADVMVNASDTGSMDKAVLEAMACGLPVVTSNEAFHAILAPWNDRLIIPPHAADALASQLKILMALSPDQRAALGLQLRALVVAEHSLDRLIDKLMTVLIPGE